jgi:hypothetical protein
MGFPGQMEYWAPTPVSRGSLGEKRKITRCGHGVIASGAVVKGLIELEKQFCGHRLFPFDIGYI